MDIRNNQRRYYYLVLFFGLLISLAGCSQGKVLGQAAEPKTDIADPVAPGLVATLDSNIIISQPLAEAVVASPLTVSGRAAAASGEVNFLLTDDWGNVLATSTARLGVNAPALGDFSVTMAFSRSWSQNGRLQAFTVNAADGSVADIAKVGVLFQDYASPKFKLFFSNVTKDPKLEKCEVVYPVERTLAPTNQLVTAIIGELLKGADEAEMKAGFVSNLPEAGVKVNKTDFKDGKFVIDFNQALQAGVKGACRVAAIRAQITETLKQFPEVKEVIISIDGKTEGILKP